MELNPRKNISRVPAQSAKRREMWWTKVWTWSTAQPTISEISVFLSLVASHNTAPAFAFMSFAYTPTTADLESYMRLWHHHANSRHLKSPGRKEPSCFLTQTPMNAGRLKPRSDHKAGSPCKDKYVYLSHIKPPMTLESVQCQWLSFQSPHARLPLEKTKQQKPSAPRRPR